MALHLDFTYFDKFPQFRLPVRSRRGKFTSSSREEEHTDSGNESSSDHCTLERQAHLGKKFFNRQIVTLQKNTNEIQTSANNRVKVCDPKEGVELNSNDVIVMGRYMDFNEFLIITYSKVCDIDQTSFVRERTFIIKILKNIDPSVKLRLMVDGVPVSDEPVSAKQTPAIKAPKTLIELERSGTKLHFEQMTESLQSEGMLTFFKAGKGKQKKKLFDVKINIYCYQINVISEESPLILRNFPSGCRVVKEHKRNLIALIDSDEDVNQLFGMRDSNSLIFTEICISLLGTSLTEEKIESFIPIRFELHCLTLHVASPSDEKLHIAFLSKVPFCKKVRFEYFISSVLDVKRTKGLKSKPKLSHGAVEQMHSTPGSGENFSRMIISCYKLENLCNVELFNFEIKTSSLQKIIHMREVLDKFVSTRNQFVFNILNPKIKAENGDFDITLIFLILLTSQIADVKERSFNEMATGTIRLTGIADLSMEFSKGNLNNLRIDLAAQSNSSEELRKFCFSWSLRDCNGVITDNFFLLHEGFNYTWMFQLNNLPTFSWLQILTGIGNCRFNRDTLIETTAVLSGTKAADFQKILAIPEIVINVTLSDSRSEMDELVSSFCETFQNLGIEIKSLRMQVEADDSGWSFFRFTLTSRKIVVVVSHDVIMAFPFNSTKDPRVVAIEVHTIPNDLIRQVNEQNGVGDCEVSPLVCIDQFQESPFLQPVSVLFRYPMKKESFNTSLYSKHPPETVDWNLVQDYEIILLPNGPRLQYQSFEFSPVISIFGGESGRNNPINYVKQYFANCAFVTILSLEHRIGNVVFDCLQEKNESEMKQLKVSRHFEKRKVGKMKNSQELFASLGKNLTVAEPALEDGERLHFFCPDNVKNEQEYTMKKVDIEGAWRGLINYSLKTDENEDKLFHMWYHVPNEPMATTSIEDIDLTNIRRDEKKVCLEKALYILCRDMQNPNRICNYLVSECEMSIREADEIRGLRTKDDRNFELVKHVLERGSTAYDQFRQALIEVENLDPRDLAHLLPDFEGTPCENDVDELNQSQMSLRSGDQLSAAGSGSLGPNRSS